MTPESPPSALLSPPRKTPPPITTHPFFTPRRSALSKFTSGLRSSRVHLLSPEESPSRRCKKARLETPTELQNESRTLFRPRSPLPDPIIELVEPRKRITPSIDQRIFMRSINGFGPRRIGTRDLHCGDWSSEGMGFYSRPQDVQSPAFEETTAHLPFSTLACNRNSLVAVGDESGNVRITESAKDEHPGFLKPYITLKCHDNAIFDMAWSPDDHLLATASGDQGCNIMDMIQQRQLFSLRGHDNSVKQIMFNPHNPHILASSSRDGKLNIWDLRVSGLRVQEQQGILTVLQPVQSIQNAHTLGKTPTSVTSVVWTQEYRVATAGQTSAAVKVWDLKSSLSRKKQPLPVETSALPVHHQGHRDFGISCLTLSPDSQRLYAVCKDSNVYAYSTNHLSQGPIHAYNHPKLMVSTFFVKSEISRDGRFLATGSSNGTPILFPTDEKYFDKRIYTDFSRESSPLAKNMQVGRGIALVRGHEKEVTDVTWTIEGDLVTISDDCNARCWRSGVEGEAHSLREGGEHEGRRWMWGWAEMD